MSLTALPANGVWVPQSTGRLSPAQYAQLVAGKHLYFYIAPQGPYRGHSGAAARNYRIAASRPHGYIEVGMSAKFFQMGGIARFPNFTALDNFYSVWHAQSNSGTLFKIMDNYVAPAIVIGVTGAVLAGFGPAVTGAPVGGGAAPGLSNAQIIAAGNAEGDAGGGLASTMATSGASLGGTLITQGEAIATKAAISTGLGMVLGGGKQPTPQPTANKPVALPAQNSNMILLLGLVAAGLVLIF